MGLKVISSAFQEDEVRFFVQLAKEIVDTAEGVVSLLTNRITLVYGFDIIVFFQFQGKVIKRKQDLHRLCEANRAYAHYRWS